MPSPLHHEPAVKHIVLVASDRIGTRMAGPAVRYYQFARELAKSTDVTLVVPTEPDFDLGFAEVIPMRKLLLGGGFRSLARRAEVIVSQQLDLSAMRFLARTDVKVVYDLYDPLLFETLPLFADEALPRRAEQRHRYATLVQTVALSTGDAFICASERQRDLWLGILGALGRIDLDVFRQDPTLRSVVEVVPFGVEREQPQRTSPSLKGVVQGIESHDRVLLWGGGIWNWFDPLTVIRAVAQLSRSREDLKLYFLGLSHPNPNVPEMAMAGAAVALARELGVEGRSVIFNFGWVPYDQRQNFLLEADLGVSAHFDSVETRYAFRTRLLDYFWAGLPTLTSPGDVLADLVREQNLGRVIGFGDVEGWRAAIEDLLDSEEAVRMIRENLLPVREEFSWPNVVDRLRPLLGAPTVLAPGRGASTLWSGGVTVHRGLRDVLGDGYRLARTLAKAESQPPVGLP